MSASTSIIDNEVPTTATVEQIAVALRNARDTSRQIVPIVGAGLSADSGFPVVTAIVRYFGKLSRYIKKRVPLAELPDGKRIDELDKRFDDYFLKPWEYVEAFGWPDRFQLNQDLFTKLSKNAKAQTNSLVEEAVREGLDDVLPRLNLQGHNNYDKIESFVEDLKKEINPDEINPDDPLIKILNRVSDRLMQSWGKSTDFDVVGDWRRLILTFTNYQSDDADALFARFGATRVPGQGHRFLAFLVRSLAVPTVFTFNFDTLIEQAMESAGIKPRVFAMERGAGLPHARMVRDQLSVIKMHGSTHALLLDEQLDRPLTAEYLQRFARIAGQDPLLLVVGCSEGDRRLRDIVADVLKPVDDERRSNGAKENQQPSILWLHYEKQAPEFLKE